MPPETVGEFHASRTVRGRMEELPEWRVTAGSPDVLVEVARLLGGEYRDGAAELFTRSSAVEIVVEDWDETTIRFRLVGARDLGAFVCRFAPWSLDEVTGGAWGLVTASGQPVRCELAIRPMEFVTRNGTVVRYLRAVLEMTEDRKALPHGADHLASTDVDAQRCSL